MDTACCGAVKADPRTPLNMTWRADRPHNDLALLPLAVDRVEIRAVLKACIPARAALAELRQAGELLPDPGPLTSLLPNLIFNENVRLSIPPRHHVR